ncbi:hypothetical protein J7E81_15400 [Bacillus sp. ISL-18]|uniref:hypothetical protein n=1 Tax=Bacillus sp. ISL-18 TaxID=2819118 RepID=UPI001BE7F3EB|nr:hypothetical protein [Bacillus sp. ISL-18]MBT2656604.1 hypothetical protein [Bacillus sp. ISL-18]
MKVGGKKTFVYIPWLDKFIEAADTMEETVRRINEEEAKRELEDKKMLRKLQKANPGKNIKKIGDAWLISDAKLD